MILISKTSMNIVLVKDIHQLLTTLGNGIQIKSIICYVTGQSPHVSSENPLKSCKMCIKKYQWSVGKKSLKNPEEEASSVQHGGLIANFLCKRFNMSWEKNLWHLTQQRLPGDNPWPCTTSHKSASVSLLVIPRAFLSVLFHTEKHNKHKLSFTTLKSLLQQKSSQDWNTSIYCCYWQNKTHSRDFLHNLPTFKVHRERK